MGDICGDLEIYGDDVNVIKDPNLKKVWESYSFDPNYSPQFNDVSLYAEILYQNHMYQAAAPVFEQALTKLGLGNDMANQVSIEERFASLKLDFDISRKEIVVRDRERRRRHPPTYRIAVYCRIAMILGNNDI
jgi:hypothetical protein